MNIALTRLKNYDRNNGPEWDAEEVIECAIREIERLLNVQEHRNVLVTHMSEVKAIADGSKQNTLSDVVDHCIKKIEELPSVG